LRISICFAIALSLIPISGCQEKHGAASGPSTPALHSVYTDLSGLSCKKEIDKDDPNETPYLVCPGVAGYSLVVRLVDSGRVSVDVVDPTKRLWPLKYDESVTRHMSNLAGQAEWRVTASQVPVALIVRVEAHEDSENPGKVTHSYMAVAKIGEAEACVTDRLVAGIQSEAEIRGAADSATKRPCAAPLPVTH